MTGADQLAVARAAAMFNRVLAPWAMDCLRLRARGLDRPTARRAGDFASLPDARGMTSGGVFDPETIQTGPTFHRPARRAA